MNLTVQLANALLECDRTGRELQRIASLDWRDGIWRDVRMNCSWDTLINSTHAFRCKPDKIDVVPELDVPVPPYRKHTSVYGLDVIEVRAALKAYGLEVSDE